MSFYGKTFRIISSVDTNEILEKIGLSEEVYGLLRASYSMSTYYQNNDGSIRFTGICNGEVVMDFTTYPKQEIDLVTPTGAILKIYHIVDGNTIKTFNTLQNGKIFCTDSYYDADGKHMKMEIHIPGVDVIAVNQYEAV